MNERRSSLRRDAHMPQGQPTRAGVAQGISQRLLLEASILFPNRTALVAAHTAYGARVRAA